jgi:hypothetical protein
MGELDQPCCQQCRRRDVTGMSFIEQASTARPAPPVPSPTPPEEQGEGPR